jgi:hypothetical protein
MAKNYLEEDSEQSCSSDKAYDLYSGGSWLKFRLGHRKYIVCNSISSLHIVGDFGRKVGVVNGVQISLISELKSDYQNSLMELGNCSIAQSCDAVIFLLSSLTIYDNKI